MFGFSRFLVPVQFAGVNRNSFAFLCDFFAFFAVKKYRNRKERKVGTKSREGASIVGSDS